jgi:GalNAc-alpha-(1->4)-GalNAc-alpha-(1->3)-diNAcBac-PP-undecaprenol alpha-1,4-N-acetyl-D-galactosaminyltransferase
MDQKNFPLLIKSFAKVSGEYPEYVLDIYGEGERRVQLENLINELGMGRQIHLKGASKQVQKDIADAELFVMSSDFEGFPNVLLEAIAIGLPVISTDFATGIARELVGEENGIIVPVGNLEKMAAAIDAMLSNDEMRHRMGRNNKEKAKKYYTKEIIQQWNEALDRIV